MKDVVYKQDVIKAIHEEFDGMYIMAQDGENLAEWFERTLSTVPLAEPKFDEWCTDCKEYDKERHCCPRWNRVIRQTLKDAELERKKGRWQITDAYPHNVYCSECHIKFAQKHWAVWEDGSLPRNFCPNCGAEMTEGENE